MTSEPFSYELRHGTTIPFLSWQEALPSGIFFTGYGITVIFLVKDLYWLEKIFFACLDGSTILSTKPK